MLAALVIGVLPACERADQLPDESVRKETQPVPPPRVLPQCDFADGLREQYPAVAGFVNAFLQTCLSGDYAGYRKMVSRTKTPLDKEQFQAIYYAIKSVRVDSIEPLASAELPGGAHRVVSSVELHAESALALRRGVSRQIALLVFPEDDQWRMLPAPAELQPREAPAPTTTSAPASTQPVYPWEDDGNS